MRRVLVIGLDGAEPSLAEPWMDSGALPHLAGLRARGCFIPCASVTPPITFPAWTTCVTGVNPGRHGIIDFTEMIPGRYAIRFVNSTFRKAPALWNILSAEGKRCAVLGVPGTYPPEPINGVMVSGFDSPVCTAVDKSFVFPPSLYPEVRAWRFADFQESRIGPGWHERALPKLLEGVATKEAIAMRIFERERWDFFMVVFGEADTVSHHFWPFHDPQSPRHMPGPADAIRQVYMRLDAAVGRLMADADEETLVITVSDHGFGGAGTGVIHLNNWLAENGYLRFTAQGSPGAGANLRTREVPTKSGENFFFRKKKFSPHPFQEKRAIHGDPLVYGLKKGMLRYTPESWRGALFRRFQNLAGRVESASRFSGIDWTRTTAWSEELDYFPSIRVNLAGREPMGQVEPGDYDAFCAELCERLEAWPWVRRAWPRCELYEGLYTGRAPDIILGLPLEDGYSVSCLRSHGGPSFRRITPDERYGGKERGMSGTHRPTGVLFLSEQTGAARAKLADVAPTVLSWLGVAGPPMEGQDLLGGAVGAADGSWRAAGEAPYSPEEEALIETRLRDLGYFE